MASISSSTVTSNSAANWRRIQVSLEICVELVDFLNIDLLDHGLYQIDSTLKCDGRLPYCIEVSTGSSRRKGSATAHIIAPVNYRTIDGDSSHRNGINSIISPTWTNNDNLSPSSASITSTATCFTSQLSAASFVSQDEAPNGSLFKVKHEQQRIPLYDALLYRVFLLVDPLSIEEDVSATEFTLTLDILHVERGPAGGRATLGADGKSAGLNPTTTSVTRSSVGERIIRFFVKQPGLHFHRPKVRECIWSRHFFSISHDMECSSEIYLGRFRQEMRPSGGVAVQLGWKRADTNAPRIIDVVSQSSMNVIIFGQQGNCDKTNMSSHSINCTEGYFGATASLTSSGASINREKQDFFKAKQHVLSMCRLLLGSLEALQANYLQLQHLTDPIFLMDEGSLVDCPLQLALCTSQIDAAEDRECLVECGQKLITQMAGEIVRIWTNYLDAFVGCVPVCQCLMEIFRQYQLHRLGEGVFLLDHHKSALLSLSQSTVNLTRHDQVWELMRKSKYYTQLPSLPLACDETDGRPCDIPALFEDRYYHSEENDSDGHSCTPFPISSSSALLQSHPPDMTGSQDPILQQDSTAPPASAPGPEANSTGNHPSIIGGFTVSSAALKGIVASDTDDSYKTNARVRLKSIKKIIEDEAHVTPVSPSNSILPSHGSDILNGAMVSAAFVDSDLSPAEPARSGITSLSSLSSPSTVPTSASTLSPRSNADWIAHKREHERQWLSKECTLQEMLLVDHVAAAVVDCSSANGTMAHEVHQIYPAKVRCPIPVPTFLVNHESDRPDQLAFSQAKQAFKGRCLKIFNGLLFSEYPLPKASHSCINMNCHQPNSTSPLHLIVCVHGLEGTHEDMKLVRTYLERALPLHRMDFLMSESVHGSTTYRSMQHLTEMLVMEIVDYLASLDKLPDKISFIGHSLGALLVRAAIAHGAFEPYRANLYTFLSFCGPHFGLINNPSRIVTTGLWFFLKWRKTESLTELALRDSSDMRETFIYRLSQRDQCRHFQYVLLVASAQDHYAPYYSARMEPIGSGSLWRSPTHAHVQSQPTHATTIPSITTEPLSLPHANTNSNARLDNGAISIQNEMAHNVLRSIAASTRTKVIRYDIRVPTEGAGVPDNITGRLAHIAVIDSEIFLEKFMTVNAQYFV